MATKKEMLNDANYRGHRYIVETEGSYTTHRNETEAWDQCCAHRENGIDVYVMDVQNMPVASQRYYEVWVKRPSLKIPDTCVCSCKNVHHALKKWIEGWYSHPGEIAIMTDYDGAKELL